MAYQSIRLNAIAGENTVKVLGTPTTLNLLL